MIRIFVGDEQV